MTWTYTESPDTSDLDWVRFRIGDTLEDDPQFSDKEITALLSIYGTTVLAAFEAAKRLKARFSRLVDLSVGDSRSESLSQRQAHYAELVSELEVEATQGVGGGLRATGLSIARRTTVREDIDRVQPPACRGQFSRSDDSDGST